MSKNYLRYYLIYIYLFIQKKEKKKGIDIYNSYLSQNMNAKLNLTIFAYPTFCYKGFKPQNQKE